jgi:hypothetical protein
MRISTVYQKTKVNTKRLTFKLPQPLTGDTACDIIFQAALKQHNTQKPASSNHTLANLPRSKFTESNHEVNTRHYKILMTAIKKDHITALVPRHKGWHSQTYNSATD